MKTLSQRLSAPRLLLQAPMAGSQGSALALAVCAAGGIGALPAAMLSPEALTQELRALSRGTDRPWNVNFFCHTPPQADPALEAAWRQALAPFYAEAGLDINAVPAGAGRVPFSHAVADHVEPFRPPIVSFHFGLPAPDLLARVKGWGSVVLSSATTVDEALWLQAQGADAVIAQGSEAGGHRGMFLRPHAPPLRGSLPQDRGGPRSSPGPGADPAWGGPAADRSRPHAPPLRGSLPPEGADPAWGGPAADLLTSQMGLFALLPQIVAAVNLPVIAAGGIADAAGVRAALALGAAGVQVGTAYLCSDEATTSAVHRAALQSEAARHTALTTLFSGRPARGIVNRVMRELGPLNPAAPAFPTATAAMAPLRAHWERQGSGDFSPLWSGQNASHCRAQPAADLTRHLLQGFDDDL